MTKVEEIIYNKMYYVWFRAEFLTTADIERLARNAVEEIREEFKKAGVNVWKGGEE